jgi:CHAT domain-containing protein
VNATRIWINAMAWWVLCASACAAPADTEQALTRGVALRQQGHIQQSVEHLAAALQRTEDPAQRARISGELGISQLQARQLDAAEQALALAYHAAAGAERARYAIHRGNLAAARGSQFDAQRYFNEALQLAGSDTTVRINVGLNQARLAPPGERLARLQSVSALLAQPGHDATWAPYHINLGDQARLLGAPSLALAYRHLERGRQLAGAAGNTRLEAEATDALAQLYEDQGRHADALRLSQQGIALLRRTEAVSAADLLIALEWRQGRLLGAQGQEQQAVSAFERAVNHIEAVRQDIPIEYPDGRSSFRDTLEPIYLGYVDLLLQGPEAATPAQETARLKQVRDVVELIKQTELQDFMGDRCAVEAVQGGSIGSVARGTAVLYPIILPERLELLLETSEGITRATTIVNNASLRAAAVAFAERLRAGSADVAQSAQQLYDLLLRPLQPVLAAQQVQSLVVVPDGPLRMVPIGALHDGQRFVLEQYSVAMVTGMTMTNSAAPTGGRVSALVVGLATPGPVVAKLGSVGSQILQGAGASQAPGRGLAAHGGTRTLRPIRSLNAAGASGQDGAASLQALRERLALPGVKTEIEALSHILSGTTLLDADFTVDRFGDEAKTGDYRVVHIASHGVFGGSAETSYIMAYDNLLSMNGLQSVLQAERFHKTPIELLSLSACQTAEGNDRAPLGMSGAAIKARAKSVLGTLWPVDDEAARQVMERMYTGIAKSRLSKAEALRQAQLEVLKQPELKHPFYWAPFVLVGNWM